MLIGWVSSFGNKEAPTKTTYISNTAPEPENTALTNRLKQDILDDFGMTKRYVHLKGISVRGDTVEVKTDLPSFNEIASQLCGDASVLFYGYSGVTQNETIIVYGNKNNVLFRRNGIKQQCK